MIDTTEARRLVDYIQTYPPERPWEGNEMDLARHLSEALDEIDQMQTVCSEWAEVSQANYQRAKKAEAALADARYAGMREAAKAVRKMTVYSTSDRVRFAAIVVRDNAIEAIHALIDADQQTTKGHSDD